MLIFFHLKLFSQLFKVLVGILHYKASINLACIHLVLNFSLSVLISISFYGEAAWPTEKERDKKYLLTCRHTSNLTSKSFRLQIGKGSSFNDLMTKPN